MSRRQRALAATAVGLGIAGLSYAGYAAHTWYEYGRADHQPDPGASGSLLDRFMPDYEIVEHHETDVNAPAELTYAAAREMNINDSPLVRAIFAVREVPARIRGERPERSSRSLVEETTALGWRPLAEVPGRVLVMGAVTQAWQAAPVFRGLPADQFRDFAEPGYVKIVWTLEAEPLEPGRSRFRTETRAVTTDAAARTQFRRYWSIVSPGVRLIRHQSLALVQREAERRARALAAR